MSQTATVTGNQLTNALRALDINFILGGQIIDEHLHKQPARLIAALAQSDESRLRFSLIPLFLEYPEFALRVRTVAKRLDPSARLTLHCYTAQQSGLEKNTSRIKRCQITSRRN